MFTINAQIVREENALTKEEEGDDAKVRSLPSPALLSSNCRARSAFCTYHLYIEALWLSAYCTLVLMEAAQHM